MNDGSPIASLLLLLLPLLLIGFMLWSARRRQKSMAQFTASLQEGDEVFLTSGIRGRIVRLDEQLARLEVAEGVVLTVDRRAVGMSAAGHSGPGDTVDETTERA
ncbi:preprotein translocase subunit YajC [Janibacter corallicola]|uniref:preprotein translocase subunit YajC n=1 Tax=Janibacter corallicola TaxID=415212 RepID=UPI000835A693|nr:preprotein translocase subunit YajC [Janibacter corallicola]